MNTTTAPPLIQGLAWHGTDLIAIDPDIVDRKIRRKALSASTSKSMTGCLAGYAAEKLLPRVADPFSATELGTATHSIIEDLYNMPGEDRVMDAFISLRDSHADKEWSDDKFAANGVISDSDEWDATKDRWKGEVMRLGARVFEIENPAEQVTYKTEMSFEGVTIAGGVPTMGYIDRVDVVVVRERDRFKVIDLKTGKMKSAFELRRYGDEHGDQIRIYADAVKEVTGDMPAVGEIHYTQFGVPRDIPLSELSMAKTRKKFREAWDTHNKITDSGVFPTTVGPLCGWCKVVNSCPAALAAGKTASDRAPQVPPTALELGIPTVRAGAAKPMGSKLPVTAPIIAHEPDAPKTRAIAKAAVAPESIPFSDVEFAFDGMDDNWVPAAGLVAAAKMSAHVLDTTSNDNGIGTNNMTNATDALFSEGKPWEERINGKLNGASYSAIAVCSVPQIAGELLIEAGRPLNPKTLDRLTDLLAEIVITVQKNVRGGTFSWDDGINTRIRGALRTTIETMPLPWSATDTAAWEDWQKAATKRTQIFIVKSLRLFELGQDVVHSPFDALLPAVPSISESKPKPGVHQAA